MNFERKQKIESNLHPKRALVIYGPRRVGKTTLLQNYLKKAVSKKTFYSTGDDIMLRKLFQSEERDRILDFARPFEIIGLDEAQAIPKVGLGVKMIIDTFPEKIVILTGSSSFDLSQEIVEPLTGRHFTLNLLPLAASEMQASKFELESSLPNFLIFGSYPEVLLESDNALKIRILSELISSYLFKDVLTLDRIKSPDLLLDIARCLAFQVGHEVSLNEIARTVKTDVKTVGRYLDLLEKLFVIKKARGFSRNLRNEISKKAKYYFLDNGILNAVTGNFNQLTARDDIGRLWENFIFMELYKKSNLNNELAQYYFWRTHTGQEIDIIKEAGGKITAFEVKWSQDQIKAPNIWAETYPGTSFQTINKNNYLNFLV